MGGDRGWGLERLCLSSCLAFVVVWCRLVTRPDLSLPTTSVLCSVSQLLGCPTEASRGQSIDVHTPALRLAAADLIL